MFIYSCGLIDKRAVAQRQIEMIAVFTAASAWETELTERENMRDGYWEGQAFLSLPLALHYKLGKKNNILKTFYSEKIMHQKQ